MVHKLTNKIDKRKELIIPKKSEFSIPTNLRNLSNNFLQLQSNNSSPKSHAVLKDQYLEFSSDQFSATSNFLIMRKNLENTKIIISLTPVPGRTHPIGKMF